MAGFAPLPTKSKKPRPASAAAELRSKSYSGPAGAVVGLLDRGLSDIWDTLATGETAETGLRADPLVMTPAGMSSAVGRGALGALEGAGASAGDDIAHALMPAPRGATPAMTEAQQFAAAEAGGIKMPRRWTEPPIGRELAPLGPERAGAMPPPLKRGAPQLPADVGRRYSEPPLPAGVREPSLRGEDLLADDFMPGADPSAPLPRENSFASRFDTVPAPPPLKPTVGPPSARVASEPSGAFEPTDIFGSADTVVRPQPSAPSAPPPPARPASLVDQLTGRDPSMSPEMRDALTALYFAIAGGATTGAAGVAHARNRARPIEIAPEQPIRAIPGRPR